MGKFHVGDRVVAITEHPDANPSIRIGYTGTVCVERDSFGRAGVRWDIKITNGHSCGEHCEYGYGWFVNPCSIEHIEDEADFDINGDSFLGIVMG